MKPLDQFKPRCSSLGLLCSKDKAGSGIGKTAITELLKQYVQWQYNRTTEVHSKELEKGKAAEEDSITLYSRLTKDFYKKNEELLENDFVRGTLDLYKGESIRNADMVVDLKTPWDLITFTNSRFSTPPKIYIYQLNGYADLTGAKDIRLAYCLVNTPDYMIEREKYYMASKMNVIDAQEDPRYIDNCKQLDINSRFDDIPMSQRMFEFRIKRDERIIDEIHETVRICRDWLKANFTYTESPEDRKYQVMEYAAPSKIKAMPRIPTYATKPKATKSNQSILSKLKNLK